jgi:hypothetical protein
LSPEECVERRQTRTLASRELGRAVLRSGLKRRELRVDIEPALIDLLVRQGFSELYGARPLKRAVEKLALLPVAKQINVALALATVGAAPAAPACTAPPLWLKPEPLSQHTSAALFSLFLFGKSAPPIPHFRRSPLLN